MFMDSYKLHRVNRKTGFVMDATCTELDGKFLLRAGSTVNPTELKGLSKRIKVMRDSAKYNEKHAIEEGIMFDSLYDAACFVIGTNASADWFVKE